MSAAPVIETDRLLLRPFTLDDVDALHAIHRDPEVMAHVGGTVRFPDNRETMEYIAVQLGNWTLHGYGKWAVVEKRSNRLIGRVGFRPCSDIEAGTVLPELGWTFARDSWGYGFATETALASMEFGFKTLGLERIVSLITPDNTRSAAVATKIGHTLTGSTNIDNITWNIFSTRREEFAH